MEDVLTEIPACDPEENEPSFVNVTRMDRELYFEAVRARAKNGRSTLLVLGGIVAAAIGLLMHGTAVAVLGAAVAILAILSPAVIGRRDFRRLCALHPGGTWEKTVRFFSDRLESDAGSGHVTTAMYADIRREYETERLYILDFGKKAPAAAMEKSGFTLGTAEELKTFLTEARRAKYAPEDNVD